MTPEPILIDRPPVITRTEIIRSFSYKYNAGDYESRDFFCSQKAECAIEDAERVSELLYDFCKHQVLTAVSKYIADEPKIRAYLEKQRKPTV